MMKVAATIVVTVTVVTAVHGQAHNDVYDVLDQELDAILEKHVKHLYGAREVVSPKMKR